MDNVPASTPPETDPTAVPCVAMEGPVLVFGGPYSNLEATQALRAEAARLGIAAGNIVCTGDVVAYCADPVATVAEIRDWGVHVVMGNCEESLGWSREDCGCGFEEGTECAALSVDWYSHADRRLGEDDRRWMRGLPRRLDIAVGGRRLAAIHGAVDGINRFVFASTPWDDKAAQIAATGCDGVIAGHSGLPFVQEQDGLLWLNSGALGMPANDGTRHVWYALIVPEDSGALDVRLLALDYDADAAAAKMRAHSLPAGYADALGSGLWPSCDVLPPRELADRGRERGEQALRWRARRAA